MATVELKSHEDRSFPGRPVERDTLLLGRFALVGLSGYGVNLAAFAALVHVAHLPYVPAGAAAFLVAVVNDYVRNRRWTFSGRRGAVIHQGLRFLAVSLVGLGLNLAVLHVLVRMGAGALAAQAVAVFVAVPVTFLGSKLWSFQAPLEHGRGAAAAALRIYGADFVGEPRIFVAIFFRDLALLNAVAPNSAYGRALQGDADTQWRKARDPLTNLFTGRAARADLLDQAALVQIYALLAGGPSVAPSA